MARGQARTLYPPGRLEAFGDGVFSIAITLLVLEIAVPGGSRDLLSGLADQWPSFLAYLISFFSIGVVWISHYAVTRTLRGVDDVFLRLNLLLLFFVAFLPYPTRLVAEFLTDVDQERVAMTIYTLTFMAISVSLRALWFYAYQRRRLISDEISDEQIASRNSSLTPLLFVYALAVLLSLTLPLVAVAVLTLAIVFQAMPARTVYRAIRRRNGSPAQHDSAEGG